MDEPNEHGDWKPKLDPASGRTYYYNPTLKQTAWEIPETEGDSGYWVEQESPTGEILYYNPVTKARSYIKPEDLKEVLAQETAQRTKRREE